MNPSAAPAAALDAATAPSVAVVIPTHHRPEQLRRALRSVAAQDYPGSLEVIVVFDRTEPDESLVDEFAALPVRVMPNDRTPGLCGSRNTGILAARAAFVAFLDDDDVWLPGKLNAQVEALLAEPGAEFVSTAMQVDFKGVESERLAGGDRVRYTQLLASRMAMLHSSSYLIRRASLLDGIGLISETIPGGVYEDWDVLLRAARRQPIVHVDKPLVRIEWGRSSYFDEQWETKVAALQWMLDHHPDIHSSSVGTARLYGQQAFAEAALRRRKAAAKTALRTFRTNWREPRGVLALAVASGLVSASRVMHILHTRGRGV
jgi:glycosyltransferase involved in cell wall biosynthesis